MFNTRTAISAALALIAGVSVAAADGWTLDTEASRAYFGSIKKDNIGEVHSFQKLSGTMSPEGVVEVEIDLASVETNIDIRNERMIEFVFQNAPAASLSAEVEMSEVQDVPVGGIGETFVVGTLSFLGAEVDIDAEMLVARLSDTRVLAMTDGMIFLSTEDAGITAGVDKLTELAELPGITRTVPVTLRLVFDSNDD